MILECPVQQYAWGKTGLQSEVARIKKSSDPLFTIDNDKPYAELWMGTHPSGPAKIGSKYLSEALQENSTSVGIVPDGYSSNDLPFLFKVLSIKTALSIQAHPDKSLAKELHMKYPDIYKDSNHKPEMAIALTPFQALCGFRDIDNIKLHFEYYYEINTLLSNEVKEKLKDTSNISNHEEQRTLIRSIFYEIMHSTEESIRTCLQSMISRIKLTQKERYQHKNGDKNTYGNAEYSKDESNKKLRHDIGSMLNNDMNGVHSQTTISPILNNNTNTNANANTNATNNNDGSTSSSSNSNGNIHHSSLSLETPTMNSTGLAPIGSYSPRTLVAVNCTEKLNDVICRLYNDYPDDVGVLMPALLNYLELSPGECFFMGPNEPHAYLSGDCVEIMALSDNVVRSGLTSKFKDISTLCSMLHYRSGTPSLVIPTVIENYPNSHIVNLYRPSPEICSEFELEHVNITGTSLLRHSLHTNDVSSTHPTCHFRALPTASILLCLSCEDTPCTANGHVDKMTRELHGYNIITKDKVVLEIHEGSIIFLPANMSASIVTCIKKDDDHLDESVLLREQEQPQQQHSISNNDAKYMYPCNMIVYRAHINLENIPS